MKKIYKILPIFLLVGLIIFPQDMFSASLKGLTLWFNVIVPSLFPFLVIIGVLNQSGVVFILSKGLYPFFSKIFALSGEMAAVWLCGLISGYPLGAKMTGELLMENKISKKDATRLAVISNSPGPFFILGTVATGMMGYPSAGYIILISIFISSSFIAILFKSHNKVYISPIFLTKKISLSKIISSSAETLVVSGGFIILFSVITELISKISMGNNIIFTTSCAVLEIGNGCLALAKSSLELKLKLSLIAAVCGFGGFSVHGQSFAMPGFSFIDKKSYILGKAFFGASAFVFTYLLSAFLI